MLLFLALIPFSLLDSLVGFARRDYPVDNEGFFRGQFGVFVDNHCHIFPSLSTNKISLSTAGIPLFPPRRGKTRGTQVANKVRTQARFNKEIALTNGQPGSIQIILPHPASPARRHSFAGVCRVPFRDRRKGLKLAFYGVFRGF